MRWVILDSLYCEEQWQFSHLDSYSHYVGLYLDKPVTRICLNFPTPWTYHHMIQPAWTTIEQNSERQKPFGEHGVYDVAFWLDGYSRWADVPAKKRIAQAAAITNPLPWEARKPDGSPAFDLVISSIPWMVEAARTAGLRAEYMPLAFDLRARACMMGVKRDIDCLFVGTTGGNHTRRTQLLEELKDVVTALPPVFGREYFKTLARAKVVLNVHAEWAQGAANAMRLFEAAGMGCEVVSDGKWPQEELGNGHWWWALWPEAAGQPRRVVLDAIRSVNRSFSESDNGADVLANQTYECADRVPRLIELARSL